jgi:hypothetical protein
MYRRTPDADISTFRHIGAEFIAQRTDRFIAYGNTALSQCIFNVSMAQVESMVDPDGILYDFNETMQLTADLDEHLVEIPSVTQSALSFFQLPRVFRPQPVAPCRMDSYDTAIPRSAKRSSTLAGSDRSDGTAKQHD